MTARFEQDGGALRLDPLDERDLPALTCLVGAYYREDDPHWVEERQPAALRALAATQPNGQGWMIRLGERTVGSPFEDAGTAAWSSTLPRTDAFPP